MTPADPAHTGPVPAGPAQIPTFAALFGAREFPKASYPQNGNAFAEARKLFAKDVLGPDGLALFGSDELARVLACEMVSDLPCRKLCGFGDWFNSDLSGNDQLQEFDDRIDDWQARLVDQPGMRRLVVYYTGHGGTTDSRYYLAVKASRQDNYSPHSIMFDQLAKSIKRLKPPYQCFLVIDACYAGKGVVDLLQGHDGLIQQGIEEIGEAIRKEVDTELHGRGVCLFCSSPASKPSYLVPDQSVTSFMAALSAALRKGMEDGGPLLSVQDLAELMWEELKEYRRLAEDFNQQQTDPALFQEFDAVRPQVHWPRQEQGINLTTEGLILNRWKPPAVQPQEVAPEVPSTVFPAVITARQFARFVLVHSPYLDSKEAAPQADRGGVRVYLWLPKPDTFEAPEAAVRDTPIVAICDAGLQEVNRHADLLRKKEKFLADCWGYTPSRLVEGKKRALVGLLAEVLQGTFVLSAVVPKYLLSAGLKDPQASYDSILNVVLLPLVSAHAALNFSNFAVTLSPVGRYQEGVLGSALRVIRSGFPEGTARVASQRDTRDQFYLYAARLINWAETRKHHSNDGNWANLLAAEFTKRAAILKDVSGG